MFFSWWLVAERVAPGGGGGGGGGGPAPPPPPPGICKAFYRRYYWKWKKIVIFHICALPQLSVKQNQSYLRLDPPPWKNFLDRAWSLLIDWMYIVKRPARGFSLPPLYDYWQWRVASCLAVSSVKAYRDLPNLSPLDDAQEAINIMGTYFNLTHFSRTP